MKKNKFKGIIVSPLVLGGILLCVGLIIGFVENSNLKDDSTNFSEFSEDNLIPFLDSKTKLYGYMDSKGNVEISPQFDRAYEFQGSYAKVEANSKYYLINDSGFKC